MYLRIFFLFIILAISLTHFNCMPTLRSAKIQPEFSVDGTYLGAFSTTSAQDAQGNDVTDTDVDFDLPIPFDVKFRYGWEREENFGFELSGGLDGQIGAYLELPGPEKFHWGVGLETNFWLMALSDDEDDVEVSNFISENNYNLYFVGGYFPNPKLEISAGIKYQPFLNAFLDGISETEINAPNTFPLSYLVDVRYIFSEHFGLVGGAEFFDLTLRGDALQKASVTGGFIYLGLTYR